MTDSAHALELLTPCFAGLGIAAPMDRMVEEVYLPLARWATELQARLGRPTVLGVQGAQGAGKSTLAEALRVLCEGLFGLRVVTLSLDDLYLTRAERERLGRTVHPLLRRRGVPGTHDVALGLRTLDALRRGALEVPLPRFDKGTDDRAPADPERVVRGGCDLVVFEGWCVGVPPEEPAALVAPINPLETEEDPDGAWRRYVNGELRGPYQALFGRLDALVALGAPSMDAVVRWRSEQERALAASRGGDAPAVMGDAELRRFVMLFERLTRHALRVLPERADVWIALGEDHLPVRVRF